MIPDDLLQFVRQEKNIGMDFIKQAQLCGKGVYLYGGGIQKLHTVRFLQKHGVKINAILDTFQQGSYNGIPIRLFDDYLHSDPDPESLFAISSPSAEKEIRKTLEQHFPKENIFLFETTPYVEWITDVETYRAYLIEHWDEQSQMYDALADEQSRKSFINIIKGRISGKTDYFREIYAPNQYHPDDILCFSEGEVLAEIGSYDGETLLNFLEYCPDYKAAYCFEPDPKNLKVLEGIVEKVQEDGKIKIIPRGAWDRDTRLSFSNSNGATNLSHVVEDASLDDGCIEVVAVDHAIPEPITYMTISTNGSELKVLQGAKQQIVKNRPKMAVCVSYSGEAMADIWSYLRELVPEYRFYLRHHLEHGGVESYLYAV